MPLQKKKLTVADLLNKFTKVTGEEINDDVVLTKEDIKIENIRVKVLYGDQPSFNTN